MEVILRIMAYDRPGVLDRIAGLIRRMGWNISTIAAGDVKVGEDTTGLTQINLNLKGAEVNTDLLGAYLDEMDSVQSWEVCSPETHIIREMVMFSVQESEQELLKAPLVQTLEKVPGRIFAEYTDTPANVDSFCKKHRGKMLSWVRTGAVVLLANKEVQ